MPKRLIDGESLHTSKKLLKVSEKYRPEYTWLLPLALANGVAEADPRLIYTTAYAYNRDNITVKDIEAMLNEFEQAGMIARFEAEGRAWMYFVGIQKNLPKPSERIKMKRGPEPPSEIVAAEKRQISDKEAILSPTGIGIGNGVGGGLGSGNGMGIGTDIGQGNGGFAPTPTAVSSGDSNSKPQTPTTTAATPPTTTQVFEKEDDLDEEGNKILVPILVSLLYDYLSEREDVDIPADYQKFWGADFLAALDAGHTFEDIKLAIKISQLGKTKEFYKRAKPICEHIEDLCERKKERSVAKALTAAAGVLGCGKRPKKASGAGMRDALADTYRRNVNFTYDNNGVRFGSGNRLAGLVEDEE